MTDCWCGEDCPAAECPTEPDEPDQCRGCDDPWCDDCAPDTPQCSTCGAHLNLNGLCHYCDATWVWPHQAVTLHPHPEYL